MKKYLPFIVLLILAVINNCGKKQTIKFDQPEELKQNYYEIAWVEPKILLSDTLFTLIQAARVDSFLAEQPSKFGISIDHSIHFKINDDSCFTVINFQNSQGLVIRPFIARFLKAGNYKVSLDLSRLSDENQYPYYFLKVKYCDFENFLKIP